MNVSSTINAKAHLRYGRTLRLLRVCSRRVITCSRRGIILLSKGPDRLDSGIESLDSRIVEGLCGQVLFLSTRGLSSRIALVASRQV
ncbi:hypothetical protein Scep_014767 [Stephania cephalantha]|uniref:Uncharacterized protein n=1 Tax=Stephania cephalantha TaxID=152367 RepID=A0AAP0P3C0_9MAGN